MLVASSMVFERKAGNALSKSGVHYRLDPANDIGGDFFPVRLIEHFMAPSRVQLQRDAAMLA